MNNTNKIYRQSESFSEFATGYFGYLKQVLDSLDGDSLDELEKEFELSRAQGTTIFVAGNGGSATTASTMANDLGFDIIKKTGTTETFKILSLTDNLSLATAISNDVGYENIFSGQLDIHYKKGDKLLVISASGNSENLIKAAEWVKSKNGKVLGLLGFDGGRLKQLCDVAVLVKTLPGEYGPVEDVHLIINHVMAHWFQSKLKVEKTFE